MSQDDASGCSLPAFAAPHSQDVSEEVPLHRAEDAEKPAVFNQDAKNMNDEEKKSEALYMAVQGILDELTSEKFPALIRKFEGLEIDTEPRLKEVVKLIFQKAIDEPRFCKWCVALCQEMQHLLVPGENGEKKNISFRMLLLTLCQAQFERYNTAEVDSVTKSEIDVCSSPEKEKGLQLLFEKNERKIRRKSVGTCRFMGELFKHKMLSWKITMSCIRRLLTRIEEESLQCLCVLLTTIGKDLEDMKIYYLRGDPEAVHRLFKEMLDIAGNKTYQLSSQIRFVLLDVIELRRNNWVHNPRTIGEIITEMEKDEHEQKMQALITTPDELSRIQFRQRIESLTNAK